MNKFILFVFLCMMQFLSAVWIGIPQTDINLFEFRNTENRMTDILFVSESYEQEIVTVNNIDFYKSSKLNNDEFFIVGKPSFTQFTRFPAMNKDSRQSVQIVSKSEQIVNNVVIYFIQELPTKSQLHKFHFSIDESFYQNDRMFPHNQGKLDA